MRFLLTVTLVAVAVCCATGKHHAHGNHEKSNRKHHKHGDVPLKLKEGKLVTVNDEDWQKTPRQQYSKDCTRRCPKHQVCIQEKETGDQMCAKKHFIKEGRRLFKSFHSTMLEQDKKNAQMHGPVDTPVKEKKHQMHVSKPQMLEKPHNLHISVIAKPHLISEKEHQSKQENRIESKGDAVIKMQNMLLEKANEVVSVGTPKDSTVCSASKMEDMRKRLTNWFGILHKQDHRKRKASHHKNRKHKRSLEKKLRKQERIEKRGHCQCKRSVMWDMHQMDKDKDHYLNDTEMTYIEENHNEPCVRPFLKSCDHNMDSVLSKHEWCCCFADVVPPCYEHLRKVSGGEHAMIGQFVPRCNREGFFQTAQCHSSTGYCWCVDQTGQEIPETRTRGKVHCDKREKRVHHMKQMK